MSVYLAYGIVISLAALCLAVADLRYQTLALVSGVFAAPFGLLDVFFVQDYWSPAHVFGPNFSIEGVLFSFGNGVLVWLIAALPFRGRLTHALQRATLLSRFVLLSAIGLFAMFCLWRLGLGASGFDVMSSSLAGMLLVGVVVLVRRPKLLPIAVSGSIGFGGFYALQLAVLSIIVPDVSAVTWAPEVRDGLTVFGYPVEEVVWALVYGAVAPLALAYACDLEIGAREVDRRSQRDLPHDEVAAS